MSRREYKTSRMRNWLALLLMAIAAITAMQSHAGARPVAAGLHAEWQRS